MADLETLAVTYFVWAVLRSANRVSGSCVTTVVPGGIENCTLRNHLINT
jgi:hypothetical protein